MTRHVTTAAPNELCESTTERTLAGFATLAAANSAGQLATLDQQVAADEARSARKRSPADRGLLAEGDTVAGRYVIERHISSGSFGLVYKASDLSIKNHAVALKLLRKPAASEAERQAALRELQLLASVSHPSVAQFKDYGWLDGRLWFSMPWYEGITLQERLAGRALTRNQARPIFERLAYGLAAMHEVGIHHHDIKPDNIFLANVAGFVEGLPVLLDLGVAAKTGEAPSGFTAEYVAPETASAALGVERHPIGPAADVFALALTLRNCLEPATAPSSEGSPLPLLNQRANRAIDPPGHRELRYLAPSFRRWLSLDPADRPTAAEFARELAVLTLPEERRESRRRTLLRTAPVLLLLGGAVAALSYRVDQQKAQIDEQREQLTERQRETERLREESDQNLGQIESQLERMGKKDAQLRKAVAIARALDERLGAAERARGALSRSMERLKAELNALTDTHEAIIAERDALRETFEAQQQERDGLARQLADLRASQERLSSDRDSAAAQRDGLQERALIAEQELQYLRGRVSHLEGEYRVLARQRELHERQLTALREERERLLLREQVLKAQLTERNLVPMVDDLPPSGSRGVLESDGVFNGSGSTGAGQVTGADESQSLEEDSMPEAPTGAPASQGGAQDSGPTSGQRTGFQAIEPPLHGPMHRVPRVHGGVPTRAAAFRDAAAGGSVVAAQLRMAAPLQQRRADSRPGN